MLMMMMMMMMMMSYLRRMSAHWRIPIMNKGQGASNPSE
jgi:hypothetical protein